MNTYRQAHIFCRAKARHPCFFLIMCFHLVLGEVPGPCRHSVTKEHLLNLTRLIENQLQNDCTITYTFMERHGLSKVCYVKAAFPQILELLNTHFQYVKGSDNYRYVDKLKKLVYNIYSEECIPQINEEIEDNPVRFAKGYSSSLREALGKIKEVIQLYMELMTKNDKPVNWNCEEEYVEDRPESTTALVRTTGATQCHCSCPTLGYEAFPANEKTRPMKTGRWEDLMQPSYSQSQSPKPPKLARPPTAGARNQWDDIPVNRDYTGHRRLKKAKSTTSARKEEEEVVHGDISSSPFLAFPGAGLSRSPPGSFVSFDGNTCGPEDTSASCRRVHLDSVLGMANASKSSGASVSHGTSEKRSAVTSARGKTRRRTPGSTRARSLQRVSSFDSSRAIVPSSRTPTPVPSRKAPVMSTRTKSVGTAALLLAKRSLGSRVELLQPSSRTDNRPVRTLIPATYLSVSGGTVDKSDSPKDSFHELNDHSDISQAGENTRATINTVPLSRITAGETSQAVSGLPVRHFEPRVPPPVLKHESVPMRTSDEKFESPGNGSQSLAAPTDCDSPSGQVESDTGTVFQDGDQGESHFSYKIAFIVASVFGELLLLFTLYSFRKQKKLKALLRSSEVEGNRRLTSLDKDIEMQSREIAEGSGLNSS